jgi:geranylgeranyl diphosphate synthase type I
MATELLHTYLLIHDDIMDHADTRRGHPTSHVHFRDRYLREGWSGGEEEAQEYGNSMAILAGDVAHTYADQLFASVEADPERRFKLQRIYYSMCREVIDGQYLELHMGLGKDPSEDDLRRVLRLKSGLYSVERPLQLGAILAGAGPRRYEALSHYGSAMGEAFQLQDDILGMFGDPDAVGKPVGGDLLEGKFTFLVHHTLRLASKSDAEQLRQGLGRRDLSTQEVEELCAVIRDSGGLAAVETMVERRSREARDVIQGLDLAPAGKAFLLGLIGYLGARSH